MQSSRDWVPPRPATATSPHDAITRQAPSYPPDCASKTRRDEPALQDGSGPLGDTTRGRRRAYAGPPWQREVPTACRWPMRCSPNAPESCSSSARKPPAIRRVFADWEMCDVQASRPVRSVRIPPLRGSHASVRADGTCCPAASPWRAWRRVGFPIPTRVEVRDHVQDAKRQRIDAVIEQGRGGCPPDSGG